MCSGKSLNRLNSYMSEHNLHETLQSACKKHHSTETALLRISDDVLRAMDRKKCALLLLLDMSAAFDTVDHSVLLSRLQSRLGVSGTALAWFKSYLTNRKQSVIIQGVASSRSHDLNFGVPQGSVLGPLLFSIYTLPLGDIIRRHGIEFHLYADDTQLLLAFDPSSSQLAVDAMERCIAEVRAWLAANFLKLNDDKTEFVVIGSKGQVTKAGVTGISIGESIIRTTTKARNIGGVMDSSYGLHSHVSMMCSSAYLHMRNVGKIRKYLDSRTAQIAIHSLVTSRMDQLNGLLHGLPDYQLARLQRMQNTAARIVSRTPGRDHITPVLRTLHWLPIKYRVQFKLLTLTYKALHGEGPVYIKDMLTPYNPSRTLRSDSRLLLEVPRSRTKAGDRAFSVASPKLWNSLPLALRQATSTDAFKGQLKTHLFTLAF
jgi:hypothetical protein